MIKTETEGVPDAGVGDIEAEVMAMGVRLEGRGDDYGFFFPG